MPTATKGECGSIPSTKKQQQQQMITHYHILRIKSSATESEIREAYKKCALDAHPDRPGGSTAAFKMVAAAYDVLKDTTKRKDYDAELKRLKRLKMFKAPPPVQDCLNPVSSKLCNDQQYTFETAPSRIKGRFRYNDSVRWPDGRSGVIVGLAGDGNLYWREDGVDFATLFQPFGDGREIDIMYRMSVSQQQQQQQQQYANSNNNSNSMNGNNNTNDPNKYFDPNNVAASSRARAAGARRYSQFAARQTAATGSSKAAQQQQQQQQKTAYERATEEASTAEKDPSSAHVHAGISRALQRSLFELQRDEKNLRESLRIMMYQHLLSVHRRIRSMMIAEMNEILENNNAAENNNNNNSGSNEAIDALNASVRRKFNASDLKSPVTPAAAGPMKRNGSFSSSSLNSSTVLNRSGSGGLSRRPSFGATRSSKLRASGATTPRRYMGSQEEKKMNAVPDFSSMEPKNLNHQNNTNNDHQQTASSSSAATGISKRRSVSPSVGGGGSNHSSHSRRRNNEFDGDDQQNNNNEEQQTQVDPIWMTSLRGGGGGQQQQRSTSSTNRQRGQQNKQQQKTTDRSASPSSDRTTSCQSSNKTPSTEPANEETTTATTTGKNENKKAFRSMNANTAASNNKPSNGGNNPTRPATPFNSKTGAPVLSSASSFASSGSNVSSFVSSPLKTSSPKNSNNLGSTFKTSVEMATNRSCTPPPTLLKSRIGGKK